jgi:hypothetical protein
MPVSRQSAKVQARLHLQSLEGRDLPSFLPPVSYSVATNAPRDVAIADFNGDGRRDVAVSGGYQSGISVLLGDGTGALGSPTTYANPEYSFDIGAADVNLDGKTDLVSINTYIYGYVGVSVLLGNGDGTFQDEVRSDGLGDKLAIGDLNNDGIPDLALSYRYTKWATVLFGLGNGAFQVQATYPVESWSQSIQIGDLNGDGWNDLTVDNRNSYSLSVILNRGDGTFLPRKDYVLAEFPFGHALGDINKDNRLDVVVANGSFVAVLLGNGDGTLQPPQNFLSGVAATSFPVLADFNRDRKLDVATTSPNSPTVSVFLGNGNGALQASMEYVVSQSETLGIAANDLNQDRYADIVTTSSKIHVLINDTTWSVPSPPFGAVHDTVRGLGAVPFSADAIRRDVPAVAPEMVASEEARLKVVETRAVPPPRVPSADSWHDEIFPVGILGEPVT